MTHVKKFAGDNDAARRRGGGGCGRAGDVRLRKTHGRIKGASPCPGRGRARVGWGDSRGRDAVDPMCLVGEDSGGEMSCEARDFPQRCDAGRITRPGGGDQVKQTRILGSKATAADEGQPSTVVVGITAPLAAAAASATPGSPAAGAALMTCRHRSERCRVLLSGSRRPTSPMPVRDPPQGNDRAAPSVPIRTVVNLEPVHDFLQTRAVPGQPTGAGRPARLLAVPTDAPRRRR